MTRGGFISFEGMDGAGKSTHLARLAEALQAAGHEVMQTREPGGTPLGEQLRELLLHQPVEPVAEALLMWAARRQHLCERIAPALASGKTVLCDRFSDATFAYQGGARGLDWDMLLQLEQWVQALAPQPEAGRQAAFLQPDLTLWFDVPVAVAVQRVQAARNPDRFEREPSAFFEAVRAGYQRRALASPGRMVRIAADASRQQVWASVRQAVAQRGWL